MNPYAHAMNNPLAFVDPNGLDPKSGSGGSCYVVCARAGPTLVPGNWLCVQVQGGTVGWAGWEELRKRERQCSESDRVDRVRRVNYAYGVDESRSDEQGDGAWAIRFFDKERRAAGRLSRSLTLGQYT